jgi:hypothetical protein
MENSKTHALRGAGEGVDEGRTPIWQHVILALDEVGDAAGSAPAVHLLDGGVVGPGAWGYCPRRVPASAQAKTRC